MILCGPNTKIVRANPMSPSKNPKEVTSSVVVDLATIDMDPMILTTWATSHPGQIGRTYIGQEPQLNQIYTVSGEGIGAPKKTDYNKFGMEMTTNSKKIDFGKVGTVDTTKAVCFFQ